MIASRTVELAGTTVVVSRTALEDSLVPIREYVTERIRKRLDQHGPPAPGTRTRWKIRTLWDMTPEPDRAPYMREVIQFRAERPVLVAGEPCSSCGAVPRDVDPPLDEDGRCVACTLEPCCSKHSTPTGCDDAFEVDR